MSLTPNEIEILKHLLIEDEGLKQFPYMDCCGKLWRKCICPPSVKGKLTIGVGRNLDDLGITDDEAIFLLLNNIEQTSIDFDRSFPWFKTLNTVRRIVVINMAFNLGLNKFKQFSKMIKCIQSGDFRSASNEMRNSKWANQVGERAERLAVLMEVGQF